VSHDCWWYDLVPGEIYIIERRLQWELEGGHISANDYLFLRTQPPAVGLFLHYYPKWGLNFDPVLVFYINAEITELTPMSRTFRDFTTRQEVKHGRPNYSAECCRDSTGN